MVSWLRRPGSAIVTYALALGCKRTASCTAPAQPDAKADVTIARAGVVDAGCAGFYPTDPLTIQGSSLPGQLGDVLVADMDGDGNADIIFANGNDVSMGDVHVFYGGFDGGAPAATWSSDAGNYYRRLAIGDVNNDGHLDIAVAVEPGAGTPNCTGSSAGVSPTEHLPLNVTPFYPKNLDCDGGAIGDGGTTGVSAMLTDWTGGTAPIAVTVFLNRGNAAPRDFGSTPSQEYAYQLPAGTNSSVTTALGMYPLGAVSVDFGDYNGDGWLDLAVAGGSLVLGYSVPVQILANDGTGKLHGPPTGWASTYQYVTYSVRFLDWNGDGLADLLATTQFGTQWGLLFQGVGGANAPPTLSTTPIAGAFSYPLNCAIVGATDILPEDAGAPFVAAAANAKLVQATGLTDPGVIIQGAGAPLPVPVYPPLTAGVRWVDIDGDGQPDLLVPAWVPDPATAEQAASGPILCDGHALTSGDVRTLAAPLYYSQGIGVGDLDEAAVKAGQTAGFSCVGGAGRRYVVPIADPNEQRVTGVQVDGQPLAAGQYTSPPGNRLVYIAGGLTCSQTATAAYEYTRSPDFVVGDYSQCAAPLELFLHN